MLQSPPDRARSCGNASQHPGSAAARSASTCRPPAHSPPPGLSLARQHGHPRIVPQLVVVVEVLVTERNPEYPLPDQCRHKMLDKLGPPPIDEAFGKSANQPH